MQREGSKTPLNAHKQSQVCLKGEIE